MLILTLESYLRMTKLFTFETELKPIHNRDIIDYYLAFKGNYSKIVRYVWQLFNHQDVLMLPINKSKLNTKLQQEFGVLKRTANSIISYVSGRYNSLLELKEFGISKLNSEISELEKDIIELQIVVNNLARKAATNSLTDKQLSKYKNDKSKLVAMKRTLDRKRNSIEKAQRELDGKHLSLCFGSKKLFNQQYLTDNHNKWYSEFVKYRDSVISYVGSKEETACNQPFQLMYDKKHNQFLIQLRKEKAYQANEKDKYLYGQVFFSYGNKELQEALKTKSTPISYKIFMRDNRYFLQATITKKDDNIAKSNNVVDIDFNKGFIAVSEVRSDGNLTNHYQERYRFNQGDATTNDLRTLASKLAKNCKSNNQSLVIEGLNFVKKKTKSSKNKRNKKFNNMIHSFAYKQFSECCERACFKHGVFLTKVNPAYTSYIGKTKYANSMKLNSHTAASFVIARRGLGFKDVA